MVFFLLAELPHSHPRLRGAGARFGVAKARLRKRDEVFALDEEAFADEPEFR